MAKRAQSNRGSFTPGNTAALKHGCTSKQVRLALLPEQAETLAALAEKRTELVRDLGGSEALSVVARDLADRYLEVHVVADYLAQNILRLGPLSGKGKQRAALTAFLGVVDRQMRLATALGLERRAKPLVNPLDYIQGKTPAA